MKNNQKVILILVIVILLFTSFIAIFISSNIKDDIEKDNNIPEKDINEHNLMKILNINNYFTTYYVEEIYYNNNSDITYYFVKGYIKQNSMQGDSNYFKDRYCLLIVDQSNHYSLKLLDNINNLEEYAKNYELKETTINNNSNFKKIKIEDNIKIVAYINNFTDLMFLDSEKAYNMLDEETEKNYLNIVSFNNERENIENNSFNEFSAISIKENEDNTVYKVQDKNHNTITITEYYPNEFKIGIKFV